LEERADAEMLPEKGIEEISHGQAKTKGHSLSQSTADDKQDPQTGDHQKK
jgi:hypothetical protein